MAKQHIFTRLSVWLGGKQIEIKNQYLRTRFHLEFSVTHDDAPTYMNDKGKEYRIPNDYSAMFDLEMLWSRMLELFKNSVAIVLQNKILRPLSADDAKKWLKEHDPIKMDDLFPGKRSAKPLSKDDHKRALLAQFDGDMDALKAFLTE